MGVTTNYDLRFPVLGNTPNIPVDIEALADDVDAALTARAAAPITSAVPATDIALGNDAWTTICTLAAISLDFARNVRLEARAELYNTGATEAASCALRIIDTSQGSAFVAGTGMLVIGTDTPGSNDHANLVIAQTILQGAGAHTYRLQGYRVNGLVSAIKTETLGGQALAATELRAIA